MMGQSMGPNFFHTLTSIEKLTVFVYPYDWTFINKENKL